MSQVENVMSELESIGVIGDGKVLLFKPASKPALAEAPPLEEPATEEASEPAEEPVEPAEEPGPSHAEIAALSRRAIKKLEAVIEAVQDLQTVFQELHEATSQGEPHEEIQEEA